MTDTAQNTARLVSGHGLATTAADGAVLDVWFPAPAAGPLTDADASLAETLRGHGERGRADGEAQEESHRARRPYVSTPGPRSANARGLGDEPGDGRRHPVSL